MNSSLRSCLLFYLVISVLLAHSTVMANLNKCLPFYSPSGMVKEKFEKLTEEANYINGTAEAMYLEINQLVTIDPGMKSILPLLKLDREKELQLMQIKTQAEMEKALEGLGLFSKAHRFFPEIVREALRINESPTSYYGNHLSIKYLIYHYALYRYTNSLDHMDMISKFYGLGSKMVDLRSQFRIVTPLLKYSDFDSLETLKNLVSQNYKSIRLLEENHLYDEERLQVSSEWLHKALNKMDLGVELPIEHLLSLEGIPESLKVLIENSKGLESVTKFSQIKTNLSEEKYRELIFELFEESLAERQVLLDLQRMARKNFFPDHKL